MLVLALFTDIMDICALESLSHSLSDDIHPCVIKIQFFTDLTYKLSALKEIIFQFHKILSQFLFPPQPMNFLVCFIPSRSWRWSKRAMNFFFIYFITSKGGFSSNRTRNDEEIKIKRKNSIEFQLYYHHYHEVKGRSLSYL
jgi:hypothetical protein